MSDWWLNFFANRGQLIAGALALVAASVGILATYASNQLIQRSNDQLLKAAKIIERLEHQVGTVIGGEWSPLSSAQIEELRKSVTSLPKPAHQIQVMYENEFGQKLAESFAIAFRAAGWTVSFSKGSGFGRGIDVGPGPIGPKLRERIAKVMQRADVSARREDEQDYGAWFVAVGAKVD